MKKILLIVSLLLTATFLMSPLSALAAADPPPGPTGFQKSFSQFFGKTVEKVYTPELTKEGSSIQTQLPIAIGKIINLALGFIGLIMLVLFLYAGVLWLTAGGNNEQVVKAKAFLKNAVIGMILALSAFIITAFIVSLLQKALEPDSKIRRNKRISLAQQEFSNFREIAKK